MTPSGIDPATFWFVAQCLNHCATACPFYYFLVAVNYVPDAVSTMQSVQKKPNALQDLPSSRSLKQLKAIFGVLT
jgi:hypothetical protein